MDQLLEGQVVFNIFNPFGPLGCGLVPGNDPMRLTQYHSTGKWFLDNAESDICKLISLLIPRRALRVAGFNFCLVMKMNTHLIWLNHVNAKCDPCGHLMCWVMCHTFLIVLSLAVNTAGTPACLPYLAPAFHVLIEGFLHIVCEEKQ